MKEFVFENETDQNYNFKNLNVFSRSKYGGFFNLHELIGISSDFIPADSNEKDKTKVLRLLSFFDSQFDIFNVQNKDSQEAISVTEAFMNIINPLFVSYNNASNYSTLLLQYILHLFGKLIDLELTSVMKNPTN